MLVLLELKALKAMLVQQALQVRHQLLSAPQALRVQLVQLQLLPDLQALLVQPVRMVNHHLFINTKPIQIKLQAHLLPVMCIGITQRKHQQLILFLVI
jgi:hypothetical protein